MMDEFDQSEGATDHAIEGAAELRDSSVGDTPGSPTWPMSASTTMPVVPPPVGLNWGAVASALNVDLDVLMHEGVIVAAGDYFPEAGCFIDPATFAAYRVDVGDRANQPGYFLSSLTMDTLAIALPDIAQERLPGIPIVRDTVGGVIALFSDGTSAGRAHRKVLQGSLGSGISLDTGPLGTELRVRTSELVGRVATVLAAHGGAVISIGGRPVNEHVVPAAATSARPGTRGPVDAARGGTGSASDS